MYYWKLVCSKLIKNFTEDKEQETAILTVKTSYFTFIFTSWYFYREEVIVTSDNENKLFFFYFYKYDISIGKRLWLRPIMKTIYSTFILLVWYFYMEKERRPLFCLILKATYFFSLLWYVQLLLILQYDITIYDVNYNFIILNYKFLGTCSVIRSKEKHRYPLKH